MCQFKLKRGFTFFCLCQSISNFTHLGIHTGIANHSRTSSVNYCAAHIYHVFSVSQRNIFFIAEAYNLCSLIHRHAFAGQCCFFHLHACALYNSAVCGNAVTGLQDYHIACHKLFTLNAGDFSITKDLACSCGHLLKCFYGLFSLAFLQNSQNRVDNYNCQNDYYIGKAFS